MLRAIIWLAVSTKEQAEDDKESLPTQEAAARAVAEREGWQVIDVLKVPGHSRKYIDIHECARDMNAQGITAFSKLLAYWQLGAGNFDVLICRDASRFARTQALHAYVVEKTIQVGARIYSLTDGYIDQNNYRMFIAMGGYASASETDKLRERHKIGMHGRFKKALPANELPFSHIVVGDKRDGTLRMVLDPAKAQFWRDLRDLLLEGHSYTVIVRLLAERGWTSKDGRPYSEIYIWRLLHTPFTWGHMAWRWHQKWDTWVFDPSQPVPDGMIVERDRIPAVYTGEDAERVILALKYRAEISTGRNRRTEPHRFTGLLVCATCGNNLVYADNRQGKSYWACQTNKRWRERVGTCPERKYIPDERVENEIRAFLAAGPDELFTGQPNKQNDGLLAELRAEQATLERQIRTLIEKQGLADVSIQYMYTEQIEQNSGKLSRVKAEIQRLLMQTESADTIAARERSIAEIKALTINRFFEQPDGYINSRLHGLFGRYRLLVRGGEIIDFKDDFVR